MTANVVARSSRLPAPGDAPLERLADEELRHEEDRAVCGGVVVQDRNGPGVIDLVGYLPFAQKTRRDLVFAGVLGAQHLRFVRYFPTYLTQDGPRPRARPYIEGPNVTHSQEFVPPPTGALQASPSFERCRSTLCTRT